MTSGARLRGRFVWHDLLTTDPDRAASFFAQLFPEWSISEAAAGDSGYRRIEVGGREAAGIVPLTSSAQISSHWLGYVCVDNCVAAERAAEAAGGSCLVPTLDVTAVGRSAVVQDPQGATIKPFEPARDVHIPDIPASGQFCWNELLTSDVAAAQKFYQSLFGWAAIERPMGNSGLYTLFRVDDQDVAAVISMPGDSNGRPAWLTYLYAEDLDSRASRAEALGATLLVPPSEISGLGRFAVFEEPTGSLFALFRIDR